MEAVIPIERVIVIFSWRRVFAVKIIITLSYNTTIIYCVFADQLCRPILPISMDVQAIIILDLVKLYFSVFYSRSTLLQSYPKIILISKYINRSNNISEIILHSINTQYKMRTHVYMYLIYKRLPVIQFIIKLITI